MIQSLVPFEMRKMPGSPLLPPVPPAFPVWLRPDPVETRSCSAVRPGHHQLKVNATPFDWILSESGSEGRIRIAGPPAAPFHEFHRGSRTLRRVPDVPRGDS